MLSKLKQVKARGIMRSPNYLLKLYFFNIVFFLFLAAIVNSYSNIYNEISWWWFLCLIPLFLNRLIYIMIGSIILSVITAIKYQSEVSFLMVLMIPLSVYLGHLSAVFIHNAVHYNFKPRWLNRFVGELCALHQVSAGFSVFQFIHFEHHAHWSDSSSDPHSPVGKTFWEFIDTSRWLIISRLETIYKEIWPDNSLNWKIQNSLLVLSRFSKVFFIFTLIGPKFFVLFFLPSYISNVLLFAAFNYFTHSHKKDEVPEIYNLDSNLYFRICNKILFGVMYHKNHHLNPKLFNPLHLSKNILSDSKEYANAINLKDPIKVKEKSIASY